MYLSVPSYPNPYSTTSLQNVYLFISATSFDFLTMSGRVEVAVYADAASAEAGLPPITRVSYPIPAIAPTAQGPQGSTSFGLPTLSAMISDKADVFAALEGYFYGLVATDPQFQSATVVMDD